MNGTILNKLFLLSNPGIEESRRGENVLYVRYPLDAHESWMVSIKDVEHITPPRWPHSADTFQLHSLCNTKCRSYKATSFQDASPIYARIHSSGGVPMRKGGERSSNHGVATRFL